MRRYVHRLPVWAGWAIGAAAGGIFVLARANLQVRRSPHHLYSQSVLAVTVQGIGTAVLVLGPVAIMSVNRNPRGNVPVAGVPTAVVITGAVLLAVTLDAYTRARREQIGE